MITGNMNISNKRAQCRRLSPRGEEEEKNELERRERR